jgi:hypothetical protein
VPKTLDGLKARELVRAVERLGDTSSFRNLLKETARQGIIKDNKTLRAYLDLLMAGKVLDVHTRDVGSVYRQQIYFVKDSKPKVWVGLGILQRHGLNWDMPLTDIRPAVTDFDGLVRSRDFEAGQMASLEDCLVDEVHTDAKKNIGTISLVIAMIATIRVDLPYLLRRADQMHVGKAVRILFRRILEVLSSNRTELDATSFLAVRDHFLKIVRQYTLTGFWKIVEAEVGTGNLGLSIVNRLTEYEVVVPAAKQLGVVG